MLQESVSTTSRVVSCLLAEAVVMVQTMPRLRVDEA